MDVKFQKFVDVCKEYGLAKDAGTLELFHCYTELYAYVHFDRFEQRKINRYELVRLIKLLDKGKGIIVGSSDMGKVDITDDSLKVELLLYLHKMLSIEGGYLYELVGRIPQRKEVGTDLDFKGYHFTAGWGFRQPFTEEQLDWIENLEGNISVMDNLLKGKGGASRPALGYYVQYIIGLCPKLFGDFLCNEQSKQKMKDVPMFNLVGQIMYISGVLGMYCEQNWINKVWFGYSDTERWKMLKNWLDAYIKASEKLGYTITQHPNSPLVPPDIMEIYENMRTLNKTPMDISSAIAQLKQLEFAQEEKLFNELEF